MPEREPKGFDPEKDLAPRDYDRYKRDVDKFEGTETGKKIKAKKDEEEVKRVYDGYAKKFGRPKPHELKEEEKLDKAA